MSQYDNNMQGVLFKNDKRESDSHPHAKGSAEINGVEYWVSAWTNTDKNGNKYQKLKFTPKEETNQRGRQQARQVVDSGGGDFDDDLPFAPFERGTVA
jgi:hypothetical protein